MPLRLSSPARRRINALRLTAQRLGRSDLTNPREVVRWMLAMQGQDFPGALWSVALRVGQDGDRPQPTESAVREALVRGEIVRSWPMRGTLHLAAAEDVGWMLDLTGPRVLAGTAARRAALGLTEPEVERARQIVTETLADGRVVGRADLLAAIDRAGVSTAGQRSYHILWYLSQTGTLIFGPPDGSRQTFALLEAWCPQPRRLERDEALTELARRYFMSHGPATLADLARWSALTASDLRRGIASAGEALTTLELEGRTYFLAPDALDTPAPAHAPAEASATTASRAEPDVRLLPGFDEYVLGYADRSAALAPEHADAIVPGGNGMFRPTILIDGEVAGTWSKRLTARQVIIETRPFAHLGRPVLASLRGAADAYGAFIERPARLALAE